MEREFLNKLGISAEQVDAIMAEHGKTVNPLKSQLETLTSTNKELDKTVKQRDKDIADLKKITTGAEDLQKQIDTLVQSAETEKAAYDAKIRDLQIASGIKLELLGKAHDPDIVTKLIDTSKIVLNSDGTIAGLKEQLEPLQKDKSFLFIPENEDKKPNVAGMTPAEGARTTTNEKPKTMGARLGSAAAESAKAAASNPYFGGNT